MEQFIDEIEISVCAGHGGPGSTSFRREAYVPKGGPDGGNGGNGGDVVFICDRRITTFFELKKRKHFKAQDGEAGKKRQADGKRGEDIVLQVPLGTIIYDEAGEVVADFTKEGDSFVGARGGLGGKGNVFYATSTNQSPDYAQHGLPGEEANYRLVIKLIADVGFVGFPNAGKSTLLSVLTRAHPKIANYPFTTLSPNLGVCSIDFNAQFVIADIPGIIEGAHSGAGLGLTFLKHIERTRLLAFVLDISESGYSEFTSLRKELSLYSEKLEEKPFVIVFTKKDLIDDELEKALIDDFRLKLSESEKKRVLAIHCLSAFVKEDASPLAKDLYHITERIKQEETEKRNSVEAQE